MLRYILLLILLATAALAAARPPAGLHCCAGAETNTIPLTVGNIQTATGRIWVGIYEGAHDFLDRHQARLIYVDVTEPGTVIVDLPGMIVGKEYALAIFHDEDNDGHMNQNWLGLPSEPWAFSGEVKTRLRLPIFDEVKFTVREGVAIAPISLRIF